MILDFDVVTDEVLDMLFRIKSALDPARMAIPFTQRMRRDFQQQISESFASGSGAAGDARWASLSPMRIEARGGSAGPMLSWTGDLQDEATRYKGRITLVTQGFNYSFPGPREMSPKAWGTFAGQLVNPLGMTPLAATPRPVLGGSARQARATVAALALYLTEQGFEVFVE